MKNSLFISNNRGISSLVVILITLGVIAAGSAYFLTRPQLLPTQEPPIDFNQPETTILPDETALQTGKLIMELKLSSLSKPKGAADIFWGQPGGFVGGQVQRAIATPLQLVDGIKITNGTNETVVLKEINNETRELLQNLSTGHATPILLLPEKFIKNGKDEVKCQNRDFFSNNINNICVFETPIEIAPKETITLRPLLFAVPNSLWVWDSPSVSRDKITFLDGKETKNLLFITTNTGKQYIFLANAFQEYDDISQSQTFNIGGLIFVNANNQNLVNNIFDFKTKNGQKVLAEVKTGEGIAFKNFELETDQWPPQNIKLTKGQFDERLLTFQIFLYRNDLMDRKDITGIYDDKTIAAIKEFQKTAGIVETGELDSATIFASRGFDIGKALWESYSDEQVTLSLDATQPNFRLFAIGTEQVKLNPDFSNSSLITKVIKEPGCQESVCAINAYTISGKAIFTLGSVNLLNNTPQNVSCTLTHPNGKLLKSFQIAPNNLYIQNTSVEGISESAIYRLQCGNKVLDIELFPSSPAGRG